MLLEFSSSQFRPMSQPAAIRFLNGVSHAPLSPEVNDSSESRGAMPPRHHIMARIDHFPSDEINNGVADSVNGANTQGGIPASANPMVNYRECMKNHAASLGGHSIDGCGEFLPSGSEGLDAFKCAACSCHRNFHRKEVEGSAQGCDFCHKDPKRFSLGPPTPALVAAPTSTNGHMVAPLHFPHSDDPSAYTESHKRRRHRTIFTLEQKEKMFFFAESLGWKILKHDEDSVQSFCDDVGVPRRIFRVWMHNHKHNMKRQNSVEPDSC